MTIDKAQLSALADRVLTDRRFCVDEYHRELAVGVQALLGEIEHLTESRQEARDLRNKMGDRLDAAEAQRDKLKAESEALRKSLLDASEEIASWGSYAIEHFQEKHELAGCVEKFHAVAMAKEAGQ